MQPFRYPELHASFERYLTSRPAAGEPDTLYAPIRYINDIGGKRIRPILVLMAYNLWHDDVTPALPAALAVEFFHNFTLMHDDIMDEAPLRRGEQTVHLRFGTNAAILSGDAMLIECFKLLIEAGGTADMGAGLCQRMADVALEICEGQQLDMDFERQAFPAEADYLEMIRKKTGVLLGLSLELGGRLAGASAAEVEALYAFGEMTGLAFQVQDDYLDVFGEADLTGKQQGGDILRGKKNFPYVHHCAGLDAEARNHFRQRYVAAGKEQHIEEVLEAYARAGIGQYTRDMYHRLFNDGEARLRALEHPRTEGLLDMVRTLMLRQS